MGTNFFVVPKACPCCGRRAESLHIGKSSAGWAFALHVYPESDGPKNLVDWIKIWERGDCRLEDEYGAALSPFEMLARIVGREPGLRRSPSDGRHCVGHGEGTFDLCIGDFS